MQPRSKWWRPYRVMKRHLLWLGFGVEADPPRHRFGLKRQFWLKEYQAYGNPALISEIVGLGIEDFMGPYACHVYRNQYTTNQVSITMLKGLLLPHKYCIYSCPQVDMWACSSVVVTHETRLQFKFKMTLRRLGGLLLKWAFPVDSWVSHLCASYSWASQYWALVPSSRCSVVRALDSMLGSTSSNPLTIYRSIFKKPITNLLNELPMSTWYPSHLSWRTTGHNSGVSETRKTPP